MFVACVKCEENINFASPKHFSRCNELFWLLSEQLSLLLQFFSFLVLWSFFWAIFEQNEIALFFVLFST